MARTLSRLSDRAVQTAKPDKGKTVKMLADGGGLYLQCKLGTDGNINRSWIFRFALRGEGEGPKRQRLMGLGSLNTIGLAEARKRAARCREMRLDNIDPIVAREAEHSSPPSKQPAP